MCSYRTNKETAKMILVIFILCQMTLAMCVQKNVGETRQSIEAEKNEICSLPKEVGPGKAKMPRFYFNAATSKCETFIFGGMEGNANNFLTKKDCEKKCSDQGQNPTSKPPTRPKPKKNRICLLPKNVGKGKANITRFYFNLAADECKPFTFGGGKGNANNFMTKEECEEKCGKTAEIPTGRPPTTQKPKFDMKCLLPKNVGKGKANMTRFYFSLATGGCQPFIFGGGKGNANNFLTKEECEEKCSGRGQKPTKQPPTTSQETTVKPTTNQPTTIKQTPSQPTTIQPTTKEPITIIPPTSQTTISIGKGKGNGNIK